MFLVSHIGKSAFAIGLLLAFACNSRASDDADVAKKLASLGVECEHDDDGNLIAVDFGWHPLATAADLSLLKRLDHVVELRISELKLGNVGFKHLASLSNLKRLYASGTKCTDADIEHLAGLMILERLSLSHTAVTDASITKLIKLQRLKWIDLSSTRVTPEGLRRLRRELPHVHVAESWDYFAGIVGGRGVLDLHRATIVFADIRGSKFGGGVGGGTIQVSKSLDDQGDVPTGSGVGGGGGGGGSSGIGGGFASVFATTSRKNGIPTIRVGEHQIEIRGEGTELVIDGQSFRIGAEKLRIVVDADGAATLK